MGVPCIPVQHWFKPTVPALFIICYIYLKPEPESKDHRAFTVLIEHTASSIEEGVLFFGLAYQGKDIVFRFIIEYIGLIDFDP
jgi:hypothetical protein